MVNVGYKSFDPDTLSSPFPGLAVSTTSLPLQVSLHPNLCLRVCIYVFTHIYFIFGCDGSSLRCAASLLLCSGFLSQPHLLHASASDETSASHKHRHTPKLKSPFPNARIVAHIHLGWREYLTVLHCLLRPVYPSSPVICSFLTNYPQLNGLKQCCLFCSPICDFSRCSGNSSSLLHSAPAGADRRLGIKQWQQQKSMFRIFFETTES